MERFGIFRTMYGRHYLFNMALMSLNSRLFEDLRPLKQVAEFNSPNREEAAKILRFFNRGES